MKASELVQAMTDAGAPMEAVLIALKAIEERDDAIEQRRAVERDRKRRQRAQSSDGAGDCHGTVTGQSADIADIAPLSLPLSPQTPLTPTHTPGNTTRARKGPVDLAARPPEVSEAVWSDFTGQRKKPFTDTALRGLKREADKAGWSLEAAIEESTLRGWEAFKADWVKDKQNGQRAQLSRPTTRQLGERAAALISGANDSAADRLPRLGSPGGYG